MDMTQAENLRRLIRHMETRVTRCLNMNQFEEMTEDANGQVCGTPACVLGEATCVPDLAALGVTMHSLNSHHAVIRHGEKVFGLNAGDSVRLFGTDEDNAWNRRGVTPQEWALEARKVLAENGYSMDEAKPIPSVAERLAALYAADVLTESEKHDTQLHAVVDRI